MILGFFAAIILIMVWIKHDTGVYKVRNEYWKKECTNIPLQTDLTQTVLSYICRRINKELPPSTPEEDWYLFICKLHNSYGIWQYFYKDIDEHPESLEWKQPWFNELYKNTLELFYQYDTEKGKVYDINHIYRIKSMHNTQLYENILLGIKKYVCDDFRLQLFKAEKYDPYPVQFNKDFYKLSVPEGVREHLGITKEDVTAFKDYWLLDTIMGIDVTELNKIEDLPTAYKMLNHCQEIAMSVFNLTERTTKKIMEEMGLVYSFKWEEDWNRKYEIEHGKDRYKGMQPQFQKVIKKWEAILSGESELNTLLDTNCTKK